MKDAQSGQVCLGLYVRNGNSWIEENPTVEVRVRQDHGVSVNWGDDVCTRREVLAAADIADE